MKEYSTPQIIIEEFTVNHTIADCGDTVRNITGNYTCLTGNQNDTGTAFSTSCDRPCKVFSGYKKASKSGGKNVDYSSANIDGLIAYCVKKSDYDGTDQWYTKEGDTTTVYHYNSHPSKDTYHCMVRGITETEVNLRLS